MIQSVLAAACDASLWNLACEVIAAETGAEFALTIGLDAGVAHVFASDATPGGKNRPQLLSGPLTQGLLRLLSAGGRPDSRSWTRTRIVEDMFGLPPSGHGVILICDFPPACSLSFYLHLNRQPELLDEDETRRLNELAVMLHEAAAMAFKIRTLALSEAATLAESVGLPQAFVDGNTRLLSANRLLSRLTDTIFSVADGCLALRGGSGLKPLRGAVERCAGTRIEQLLAARYEDTGYVVKVAPMTDSRLLLAKTAISVTVFELGKSIPVLSQHLGELYSLTRREADVARLISSGKSVREIALLHDVSGGTVREQLKSVFRKVGARGQTELAVKVRF